MRKWLCFTIFLLFVGCSSPKPTFETVTDEAVLSVTGQEEYEILVYIPQDVVLSSDAVADNGMVYRQEDGSYYYETKILLADTADSAVRQISGRERDEMTVIQTSRFGLPEYRFAWYDNGFNHRADLVQDGLQFYCVIFSAAETAGNSCQDVMAQVFASFGISSAL